MPAIEAFMAVNIVTVRPKTRVIIVKLIAIRFVIQVAKKATIVAARPAIYEARAGIRKAVPIEPRIGSRARAGKGI